MAKNINFMNEKELRKLAAEKGINPKAGTPLSEIRAAILYSAEPENPGKLKTETPPETPSEILSYDKKLAKEPRPWVRVLNQDLSVGVDFGFTFERHRWHLMNGEVVRLPVSVIDHLKAVRYPMVKYKQGEAGQSVKVKGYYYRFAITEVDEPEPAAAVV